MEPHCSGEASASQLRPYHTFTLSTLSNPLFFTFLFITLSDSYGFIWFTAASGASIASSSFEDSRGGFLMGFAFHYYRVLCSFTIYCTLWLALFVIPLHDLSTVRKLQACVSAEARVDQHTLVYTTYVCRLQSGHLRLASSSNQQDFLGYLAVYSVVYNNRAPL